MAFLCFSLRNLLGIFGALPYLVIALFFGGSHSIGGGDIKLAASTGLVLGLPTDLTVSMLGLAAFTIYGVTCIRIRRLHGQKGKKAFPWGCFSRQVLPPPI